MHTFKRGDKVWVLNTTFSGKIIVEGQAMILNKVKDMDEYYRVRFMRDGKPQLGEEYERFIDLTAQRHPQVYVNALNSTTRAA